MIVLVGEAPSRSSDPKRPFDGWSGRKLAEYAGFGGYEELAANARLVNVLQRWPGEGFAGEKGSRFPIARARRAAKRLEFERFDHVVLVGTRVAAAFGISFGDFFSWKILPRGTFDPKYGRDLVWFTCIPHPSGCNRWYNDPKRRVQVSDFLRRYVFSQHAGALLREGMSAAC
jgi:uracil-DNA glycosylase